MSQQLINHSPDLKRLRDEGYEIEICGGWLFAHHIPYVNSARKICFGTLAVVLTLSSDTCTAKPTTHVIQFIGEHPCNKDGSIITQIQHAPINQPLFDGIILNYSFSNKPAGGYIDYYHQVARYAEIISAPAKSMDERVTEKTFNVIPDREEKSVFQYLDTSSSRSNIIQNNNVFYNQKIAIIGLGGTGSYILDFLAKTPVAEIHLYDGDYFLQHNAFRSPGAVSAEILNSKIKKVNYFYEVYSRLHKGIIPQDQYITAENVSSLQGFSMVFICVDKNKARKEIIQGLLRMKVPFIDVGLGVNVVDDKLNGMVRVTTSTVLKQDHLQNRIAFEDNDLENEYATNIQVGDLNALNALFAVIKWKKLSGYYHDVKQECNTSYSINNNHLLNEDFET